MTETAARYGTREHEDWLIAQEAEDEAWGPQPDPARDPAYGGCGCLVSMVYGGDCEHTIAAELAAEAGPGRVAIEAECANCGDVVMVPGDEDPLDTLCAPCAEAEQSGEDELDLGY